MKQYCRYCTHCSGDYCNEQFYCKRKNQIMDYKSVTNKNTCSYYTYSNYDIITNKVHKERKKEDIMNNSLFNEEPCTILACDIQTMSEREFLKFCKDAYRKAHNIEEKININKNVKDYIIDFTDKMHILNKDKNYSAFQMLTNVRYNAGTGTMLKRMATISMGKDVKEMDRQEQETYCNKVKQMFEELYDFCEKNADAMESWKKTDRNISADKVADALYEKNIGPYIKKYIMLMQYSEEPAKNVTTVLNKLIKNTIYSIYIKAGEGKGARMTSFTNRSIINELLDKMLPLIYNTEKKVLQE